MSIIVNTHEAKTHLSSLLEQVSAGQEIVIAKAGKPVAKLVPILGKGITLGFLKGKIRVADDFDEPLSEEVLDTFYGIAPPTDDKQ